MDTNTILKRGEKHVFNEVDGELVMMNIETGEYVSMNPTGKVIWDLLEEEKPLQTVLDSLMDVFDVDSDTVQQDVIPFIEQLKEKEILL